MIGKPVGPTWQIMLPRQPNGDAAKAEALASAQEFLERALLDAAGGFTITPARGAWRDSTGQQVQDAGYLYTVSTYQPPMVMAKIAERVASLSLEESIYVVDPDGLGQLVEAPAAPEVPNDMSRVWDGQAASRPGGKVVA